MCEQTDGSASPGGNHHGHSNEWVQFRVRCWRGERVSRAVKQCVRSFFEASAPIVDFQRFVDALMLAPFTGRLSRVKFAT